MFRSIHQFNGNSRVHFPLACRSGLNPCQSQLPPKPTMVRMTKTRLHDHPYWASLQADIEAHLKQAMPMKEPLVVFEPMHHLTFAAPRTTVPALCLAACELVGGQRHQAMAVASALLLLQAATYTHEHLPLTDRPKPNPEPMISHAYTSNVELLTPDGIVPFGFELIARSDDPAQGNSERILRVIVEISRAVGSQGVINAQYTKNLGSQLDGGESCHVEGIKHVAEGGLHACAAACGAVLGGGSEKEIESLKKYGVYVGMIEEMLQRIELGEKGLSEEDLGGISNLALKELQVFKGRDIQAISSVINV